MSKIDKTDFASLTTGFPASENLALVPLILMIFRMEKIRMFEALHYHVLMLLQANVTRIKKKACLFGILQQEYVSLKKQGKAIFKKIDEDRYQVNYQRYS